MSKDPTLLKANQRSTLASEAASTAIKIQSKIEMRPIDSVKPNPRNARTHSKKQIKQIARSEEQFGFINPIIIDEFGMVLAGHGRLQAARLLGLKEVPVVEISHLERDRKASLYPCRQQGCRERGLGSSGSGSRNRRPRRCAPRAFDRS